MRKLPPRKLEEGMILAREITTKHGQIIAEKGAALTDMQIARLSFYKIDFVYVEDDDWEPEEQEAPAPEPEETPEPEPAPEPKPAPVQREPKNETIPYSQKLKGTSEYQKFQLDYSKCIALMTRVFNGIVTGDYSFSKSEIISEVDNLVNQKTTLDLFDMLHTFRSMDDSVYAHSLNVCMIARSIGKWLKMGRDGLDLLTLAGWFHDIGKLQIPEEILNKTGNLTDEEFAMIREHPLKGRKLLNNVPGMDERIKAAALQHHERFDGSGYPRGLQGDEIDQTAAIVAIADVYDAMTAARAYRQPKCAFQVIEAFEDDGLQKYDPKIIMTFLDRIASSYQNNRVVLSDGRSGRVIYINKSRLSKPMVQFDDGSVTDLSHTPGLSITSII